MKIAVANSRREKYWKNREMPWEEFTDKLSRTYRTSETMQEYRKLSKAKQDEIKDIGGFVGGFLIEGRRKKGYVKNRTLLTLDADYATSDFWNLVKDKYTCCIYSTHKHTAENPRLRLVILLKRPVTAEEYPAVARMVARDIGIEMFDDTTYEPTRLMYWPSTSADGEFIFEKSKAGELGADEVLARYDDWRDSSQWPVSERQKKLIKSSMDKQADPLEKPGIVGVFCRTYGIDAVIEKFLADIYEPCDHVPGRYSYIPADSTAGVVVYDGKFAYSHHASDPACGKLCNAFDLVRLHRFEELDEIADENTPVGKLPSFMAMQQFAEEDEEVQFAKRQEHRQLIEEEFNESAINPIKMFFDKKKFIPMYMADWFLNNYSAIVINDELYIYDSGRYANGERVFRERCTVALGSEYQTSRINEALNYIKNTVEVITPDEAISTGDLLNLKNGLLNLQTFEFLPHSPDIKTTIQVPVEYDPKARCPAIDSFLEMVVADNIPVIEEMIGFCLISSMKYEKAFLFHGDGGNGKGTLIAVLQNFFGAENVSNVALQSLTENRFFAAELFGKMVNLHADIPNRIIEDSSLFKELTSGDRIQAERKHKAPFSFCNRAKLIFSANEFSSSKDNSVGFHRRWVTIPFPKKFTDRELREKLFSVSEMSGLLIRALKGLRRLKKQDAFSEPDSVKTLAEEYRRKSDSAYQFLKEYCSLDSESKTGKQELYDAYRDKCREWGCLSVSQANFNGKVKMIFPGITEYRKTSGRKWNGLKMEVEISDFSVEE